MDDQETTYYVRSDKVKTKKVGDDVALYLKDQKALHVLNQSALFIWECLKEPTSFDEILLILAEAYCANRGVMENDLRETIDLFLKYELIRIVK